MKKLLKTLILSLVVCVIAVCAFACDKAPTGNTTTKTPGLQYRTYDGEKRVVGYVAKEGETEIVIPDDVKKIQSEAFKNNNTITKIVVKSNVTEIAQGAFAGMKALKEIELPFIGSSADAVNEKKTFGYVFGTEAYDEADAITQNYNASSSQTYYLPKTLTKVTVTPKEYTVYDIPAYAFYGCKYLTSINLDDKVHGLGDYALYGCYSLTKVVLPEFCATIGKNVFEGCNALVGEASTADTASIQFHTAGNLWKIGDSAFKGSKISVFNIPLGVSSLGANVFEDSLAEKITLSNHVTVIDTYAFYNAKRLVEVRYGNALERIWSNAFNGCEKLRVFAPATETVADGAYVITIASTVQKVGACAFANCGDGNEYSVKFANQGIFEEGINATFVETEYNNAN